MKKPTVIIGASTNSERYSFKAAERLVANGYEIYPVGIKKGNLFGKNIEPFGTMIKEVDTITLYVNPQNQKEHYQYLLSLNPKRIIFNPGTENPEFEKIANEQGIEVVEACTLVMLATNQY